MDEKIDKAIVILADKITTAIRPEDAMKYTQSALNLAHAKSQLVSIELTKSTPTPGWKQSSEKTKGAGAS